MLAPLTAGCGDRSGSGDPHPDPTANVIGAGMRLKEVQQPGGENVGRVVSATAASVLAVDGFDETGDGKSRGTIYVQDYNSQDALSGISLFDAVLVPASLRLAPGDVVDLRGEYAEVTQLGTFKFPQGFLPQLVRPQTRFRYEGTQPVPKEIDLADLEEFGKGRKWVGMLVVVKNVFAASPVIEESSGRASITLSKELPGSGFSTAPTITNELVPIVKGSIRGGARLESVTGIVTFFSNLHIAPRSGADIVVAGDADK